MYHVRDNEEGECLYYGDANLGTIQNILCPMDPPDPETGCTINTLTGELNCPHCKGTAPFNGVLPLPTEAVVAYVKKFNRDHEECRDEKSKLSE